MTLKKYSTLFRIYHLATKSFIYFFTDLLSSISFRLGAHDYVRLSHFYCSMDLIDSYIVGNMKLCYLYAWIYANIIHIHDSL